MKAKSGCLRTGFSHTSDFNVSEAQINPEWAALLKSADRNVEFDPSLMVTDRFVEESAKSKHLNEAGECFGLRRITRAQSEQAFSIDGGKTWESNWINKYTPDKE